MSKNGTHGKGSHGRPPEVLEALKKPTQGRKEFFADFWVAHRRIVEVTQELLRLILEPADAEVIYLIGATGVGKTTVMKHVIAKLYEIGLPTMNEFPGRVPAAYIEAENPDKGSYDWKAHYKNTLLALDEVLIDKKVYLPAPGAGPGELNVRLSREDRGSAAYRRAAENALKNRIRYAFFVDEGQYLVKRKSGEGLMNQADTTRSLASRSNTLHVIGGTYDLRHLRNLNGQLARRSHTVRFRPYRTEGLTRAEAAKEIESFTQAFLTFQVYLPVVEPPDLAKHIDFCFKRCLGCVGHLKSWFKRSLHDALKSGTTTVAPEMFLAAAPKRDAWLRIAEEIAEGEAALEENDDELEAELAKLGDATERNKTGADICKEDPENSKPRSGSGKKSSTKKNRRGQSFLPRPERYPVGGREVRARTRKRR